MPKQKIRSKKVIVTEANGLSDFALKFPGSVLRVLGVNMHVLATHQTQSICRASVRFNGNAEDSVVNKLVYNRGDNNSGGFTLLNTLIQDNNEVAGYVHDRAVSGISYPYECIFTFLTEEDE